MFSLILLIGCSNVPLNRMFKEYCSILLYLSSFTTVFTSFAMPAKATSLGVYQDGTTQTEIFGSNNCTADCTVSGGRRIGNNLFHSFSEFSIPSDVIVTFADGGAANIFTQVSGEASFIDGMLAVTGTGQANFFLINPHGIVFGPNATLASAGSFITSTADSILFLDTVQFETAESVSPLLTIRTPVGLQFGANPGSIINRSQSSAAGAHNIFEAPAGLQVSEGKTLALVANGLFLEGGNLTASSGQLSLGSVAGNSTVSLAPDFTLGYENVLTLADIYLTQSSVLDVSGNQGRMSLRGRNLTIADGAAIASFTVGSSSAGSIEIVVDQSIEMSKSGILFSPFFDSVSAFDSMGEGAEVTISTGRLILKEGALISGGTVGLGNGGSLIINASESVDLIGTNELVGTNSFLPSLISTSTEGPGSGGNITIDTQRLMVTGGAQIQTVTYGPGKGGNLTVNASDQVYVSGAAENNSSRDVSSGLRASSGIEGLPFQPTGAGGNLSINTGVLTIRDRAQVAVNSLGSGDSGNLVVTARSVQLDNHAHLTASAVFGHGGNLRLENLETLVLRRGSTVSTQAGTGDGQGNGGNIFIDADFVVTGLLEDADIVAKATQGHGGNIEINTRGLYGIERRRAIARNGTNDIDASSEFGISGTTAVNQLVVEADSGWLTLAEQPLETTASVTSQCAATGNRFVVTARGGIPLRPSEGVERGSSLVDLGENDGEIVLSERERLIETDAEKRHEPLLEPPLAAVEAIGWTLNERNQVVLTAQIQPNGVLPMQVAATCTG